VDPMKMERMEDLLTEFGDRFSPQGPWSGGQQKIRTLRE